MSVSGKLTLLTGVLLTIVFLAMAVVNIGLQRRATTAILRQNGLRLVETTTGALRDAMLENDPDRIQGTLETLSQQREIQRIRIFSPDGSIAYSTIEGEPGQTCGPNLTECSSCHQHSEPLIELPTVEMVKERELEGHPVLSLSQAIRNDITCSTASCHVHKPEELMLGVMSVDLSLESYHKAIAFSAMELLLSSLVGILLALSVIAFAARQIVNRPIRVLIHGAKQLARGDLGVRVPATSHDEIGLLSHTFNQLAHELKQARQELLEWGNTLETRVERKTQELSLAHDQMRQVDKMASLGKLAAVVAHEINNPLASVVTYARLVIRRLKSREVTEDCQQNLKYLDSIASEAGRCGEIVSRLLAFSRRDSGVFEPTDLNQVIEQSLFLINHQMEINGVEIRRESASDLPRIEADGNQLQQAIMALLINAAQAMSEGGHVNIITRSADKSVELEVVDDGPGMEPDVARHAFEPFYTTKDDGHGVGLGLSVVYGIVERHGGQIELQTSPGQGCRFLITLPVVRPVEWEAGS